ncbi:hypothetical protein KVP09_05030 [Alcaligenaceae bacterium CGII-47]|nr:hypothetical protein [Alcaligenaceae bacterium CGII-47]
MDLAFLIPALALAGQPPPFEGFAERRGFAFLGDAAFLFISTTSKSGHQSEIAKAMHQG